MKIELKRIYTIKPLLIIPGIVILLSIHQVSAQRGRHKMAGNPGGNRGNRAPVRKPAPPHRTGNFNNSGNRNTHINNSRHNNNMHVGNNNVNVNVNKNIHVNNNRNTVVRRNGYHPYGRPPYRYGGRRYYAYHPYFYHPYHPFFWGPVWHPWGFFITTLAATAIIISIENQQYHYDQGVYYTASNGGYTVVPAPVGATITTLPTNSQTVVVNETTNNYYYGGTYYEKSDKGYKVVAPTAGTVVESLPEGGEEVTIGTQKYIKFGETYYQPIQKDGKDMYEVATVESDKDDK